MKRKTLLVLAILTLFISLAFGLNSDGKVKASTAAGNLAATTKLSFPLADETEALLLSCMDFRLVNATAKYMNKRGLLGEYDHVILAGASLGATSEKVPAWNTTFWEHLEVAIELHRIQKVIILDHKDCGAYRKLLGEEAVNTPEKELAEHEKHLIQLRDEIKKKYPRLEVETLIMNLKGKVEPLPAVEKKAA